MEIKPTKYQPGQKVWTLIGMKAEEKQSRVSTSVLTPMEYRRTTITCWFQKKRNAPVKHLHPIPRKNFLVQRKR